MNQAVSSWDILLAQLLAHDRKVLTRGEILLVGPTQYDIFKKESQKHKPIV